jgi:tetratricopeptide (TPR) repeat protein
VRISVLALALAISTLSSAAAFAQESPASATEEPTARAAALFDEAEARYVAGDVAGALASMQASYEISKRAELLFNLGELRRELGQCVEARESYTAYLEQVPESPHRERAVRALDVLRVECPEPASSPPVASPPPSSAAVSESPVAPATPVRPIAAPPAIESKSWAPTAIVAWSAIGAAVVTGAGATYFAVKAANDESRLEARIKTLQAESGEVSDSERELEANGRRAATWAQVLGVGAAGLATLGVSLLVFAPNGDEKGGAGLAIEAHAGGANAVYVHAF